MNDLLMIYRVKNTRKKRLDYCSYGGGEVIRFNSDALANAIIVQACDDYRVYRRRLRKAFVKKQRAKTKEDYDKAKEEILMMRCEIKNIERFLMDSDIVALASNGLGKDILRRLKREA